MEYHYQKHMGNLKKDFSAIKFFKVIFTYILFERVHNVLHVFSNHGKSLGSSIIGTIVMIDQCKHQHINFLNNVPSICNVI